MIQFRVFVHQVVAKTKGEAVIEAPKKAHRAANDGMKEHSWVKEFPAVITVCDEEGIVLEMNDKSLELFQDDGGEKLIGTNMLDCHPEAARAKLEHLMETHQPNVYTIQKKGKRKLVYQTPWFRNGAFAGMIEMILELPEQVPHFNRDS